MTYPFAGVIKMETIKDEDGNDKVVWDEVKYECGPIVGPYRVKLDSSMNVGIGKHQGVARMEMTYHKMRPTQFEVDNGNGIALDIRIDPESLMEGPRCFEIEQDTDKINVTLTCLRALVAAAEELEKQR